MNHDAALSAYRQSDGTIDMPRLARDLEKHFHVNVLDAAFTGGSHSSEIVLAIYQRAREINAQLAATRRDREANNAAHLLLNVTALLVGVVSALSPLVVMVALA